MLGRFKHLRVDCWLPFVVSASSLEDLIEQKLFHCLSFVYTRAHLGSFPAFQMVSFLVVVEFVRHYGHGRCSCRIAESIFRSPKFRRSTCPWSQLSCWSAQHSPKDTLTNVVFETSKATRWPFEATPVEAGDVEDRWWWQKHYSLEGGWASRPARNPLFVSSSFRKEAPSFKISFIFSDSWGHLYTLHKRTIDSRQERGPDEGCVRAADLHTNVDMLYIMLSRASEKMWPLY